MELHRIVLHRSAYLLLLTPHHGLSLLQLPLLLHDQFLFILRIVTVHTLLVDILDVNLQQLLLLFLVQLS